MSNERCAISNEDETRIKTDLGIPLIGGNNR